MYRGILTLLGVVYERKEVRRGCETLHWRYTGFHRAKGVISCRPVRLVILFGPMAYVGPTLGPAFGEHFANPNDIPSSQTTLMKGDVVWRT